MGQLLRPDPQTDRLFAETAQPRVLVVDDDPVILRALQLLLELEGCEVVSAVGGAAGLKVFERAKNSEHPFAIVFTDQTMPGIDGSRLAEAIKDLSAKTSVVLLSGVIETIDGDPMSSPHVDLVMRKPPKRRELAEALLALINR